MAPSKLRKTFLATFTAAALGFGTLAGAGAASAAPVERASTRAAASDFSAQAVNNLGLSTSEAKSVQCYVRDARPVGRYNPGTIDGKLGTRSWKAWQLFLNDRGFNAGTVDGIVGPNTIRGLQRFLVRIGYDTGGIDGIAGPKTRAAWEKFSHLSNGSWC